MIPSYASIVLTVGPTLSSSLPQDGGRGTASWRWMRMIPSYASIVLTVGPTLSVYLVCTVY